MGANRCDHEKHPTPDSRTSTADSEYAARETCWRCNQFKPSALELSEWFAIERGHSITRARKVPPRFNQPGVVCASILKRSLHRRSYPERPSAARWSQIDTPLASIPPPHDRSSETCGGSGKPREAHVNCRKSALLASTRLPHYAQNRPRRTRD